MRLLWKFVSAAVLVLLLAAWAIADGYVPYKAKLASYGPPQIVFPQFGTDGRPTIDSNGRLSNGCPANMPLPDGGSMPPPPGVAIVKMGVTAIGQSTLMGLTVSQQFHCTLMPLVNDPTLEPPEVIPFFDGTATLTGANGDKLIGTYAGLLILHRDASKKPTGYDVEGVLHTYDGTGRFAGATGRNGTASGFQTLEGDSVLVVSEEVTSPGFLKH